MKFFIYPATALLALAVAGGASAATCNDQARMDAQKMGTAAMTKYNTDCPTSGMSGTGNSGAGTSGVNGNAPTGTGQPGGGGAGAGGPGSGNGGSGGNGG